MRAVVYTEPRVFEVRDVPDPHVGPGDVLVEVERAGVCGTDLHLHHGDFGPTYPLTPGHELAGRVVARGADARLAIGTRVVADNTIACGTCASCRRGRPAYCTAQRNHGVNASGAFAELVSLPEGQCFPADDLEPDVAVFAEPVACVIRGLDVLAPPAGASALVLGAGPTGMLMAQLLRSSTGVTRVVVAAPSQAKLDLVTSHGADAVVRLDRAAPAAALPLLREHAPDGYDVVVDATGAVAVLDLTIPLTRTGGTVLVYGMTAESDTWTIPPYEVFRRELTIRGSFAQQFSFDRSVAALRTGAVDTSGILTHRFGLDDYAAALEAVADGACIKAVVEPGPR